MDQRFFVFLVTPQGSSDLTTLRTLSRSVAEKVRAHGTLVDCGTNHEAGRVEGHCLLAADAQGALSEALHALPGVHSVGILNEGEERHDDRCILR